MSPIARRHVLVVFVVTLALAAPAVAAPAAVQGSRSARSASAGPKALPGLTPTPPDTLTRALRSGALTPARYALARAASLFDLAGVRERSGAVRRPDPR